MVRRLWYLLIKSWQGQWNEERKLDISRFLISGENKIDVKIGGMRDNTIGPFYLQDTLSQIPPSGYCYKFLPSGLYDDFSIVER